MNNYKVDKSKPVKVDLGCGINYYKGKNDDEIDEWIHVDFDPAEHIEIICDWSNIPIESGVVDIIHTSETVEHIPAFKELNVMKEWNRILKIGGKLIGTTPNFNHVVYEYTKGTLSYEHAQAILYGDRADYGHCHYRTFIKETLTEFLEKYGFGEIDLSESPGENIKEGIPCWWLVFKCIKIKDI